MERQITQHTHTHTDGGHTLEYGGCCMLAMDVCMFTQSYLGAMNTCPSDSKVFGSRDSKSATEMGKIIRSEAADGHHREILRNNCCSSPKSAGTQWARYHSNTHGGSLALATMVPWIRLAKRMGKRTCCVGVFCLWFDWLTSENWLDSHQDQVSSQTQYSQTLWRVAFFFNRHQCGQLVLCWDWVRQGSWWRMITPQTDSVRESARRWEGQHHFRISALHIWYSNIARAFNANTCAQLVFPHNALHFHLQDTLCDVSLRGDGQYRGVKLMKTQGEVRKDDKQTHRPIPMTTEEDLKEAT